MKRSEPKWWQLSLFSTPSESQWYTLSLISFQINRGQFYCAIYYRIYVSLIQDRSGNRLQSPRGRGTKPQRSHRTHDTWSRIILKLQSHARGTSPLWRKIGWVMSKIITDRRTICLMWLLRTWNEYDVAMCLTLEIDETRFHLWITSLQWLYSPRWTVGNSNETLHSNFCKIIEPR